MAIEIVSFPIKNGDFPWFFVCLPEGSKLIPFLYTIKYHSIYILSIYHLYKFTDFYAQELKMVDPIKSH